MKNILLLIFISILSCNKNKNSDLKVENKNSPNVKENVFKQIAEQKSNTSDSRISNAKHYTTFDTVVIKNEIDNTLKFSKNDFNKIVDEHSEFFLDFPESPDNLYSRFGNNHKFGSEAGQDIYYQLYAYFLKQKNGEKTFSLQRKKLIGIYININSLFSQFQYGGTYFGHQSSRILGYAEYSIYLLPKNKEDIEKTYDISKQKELYIKSLKQLIADEHTIDQQSFGQEKANRLLEMNATVKNIEKLITDNFYLRRAQEFQYANYEYY